MTIPAERLDIVIQKGAKFYQEFQQVQDNMVPISLAGKTLKCTIKESWKSPVILHQLDEANGGVIKVDEANGVFAILLRSDQTNVLADFGIYDILLIDLQYPDIESERIVEGKVTYTPGVTQQ